MEKLSFASLIDKSIAEQARNMTRDRVRALRAMGYGRHIMAERVDYRQLAQEIFAECYAEAMREATGEGA